MERKCILLLFPLLVLFSCTGSDVRHRLSEVESCIQSDPVLALEMLDSMDVRSLRGRRTRADFSLLYAMALDKNYIDTSDVDIAMPAVEYYDHHGPAAKSMKAWFYLGREQENGGEYQDAIISYTRAKEFAKKTDDLHFRALIASGVADLYRKTYNDEERILNSIEAYNLYKQAGDTLDCWISIGELAVAYADTRKWVEADSLFSHFFACENLDSSFFANVMLEYSSMKVLQPHPEPEIAVKLFEDAVDRYSGFPTASVYSSYAYALNMLGDRIACDSILEQIDGPSYALWKYYIYKDRHLYENALKELEIGCNYQDSIVMQTLRQSVSISQRDYFEMRTEFLATENLRQRSAKVVAILIAIVILLLAVIIIIVIHQKLIHTNEMMQVANEELDRQKKEFSMSIESSKNQIAIKERMIQEIRRSNISTYRSQLELLDKLCIDYWRAERNISRYKISDDVRKVMSSIYGDYGKSSKLEQKINAGMDNVMKKLRYDFPEYKEVDFRLLSYIIAGFEAKTISMIMDISTSSIYTKKSRMKEKILASGSENVELYKVCLE
ncbi:MAG: hypothetical protein NC335_02625 [Bacteroides sp.]|nr:hypothetical protein [Bacteroides sp.]